MPERKKVPKPSYFKSPWEINDVIAYKLEGHDSQFSQFNGKYILFKVVDIIRKPVSKIVPELAYDDEKIFVALYEWMDDYIPNLDLLEHLKFIPLNTPSNNFLDNITFFVINVMFYACIREFKKMNFKVLFNDKNKPVPNEIYKQILSSVSTSVFVADLGNRFIKALKNNSEHRNRSS